MKKWMQKLAVCSIILSSLPYNIVDASTTEDTNEITSEVVESSVEVTQESDPTTESTEISATTFEEQLIVEEEQAMAEVVPDKVVEETGSVEIVNDIEVSEEYKSQKKISPRSSDHFPIQAIGGTYVMYNGSHILDLSKGFSFGSYIGSSDDEPVEYRYKVTHNGKTVLPFGATFTYLPQNTIDISSLITEPGEYKVTTNIFFEEGFIDSVEVSINHELIVATVSIDQYTNPTSIILGAKDRPDTMISGQDRSAASLSWSITRTDGGEPINITGSGNVVPQEVLDQLPPGTYQVTNSASDQTIYNSTISDVISADFEITGGSLRVEHVLTGSDGSIIGSYSIIENTGKPGATFVDADPIVIPGYILVAAKTEGDPQGSYERDSLANVTHYYQAIVSEVITNFIDETGKIISNPVSKKGDYDTTFQTQPIEIIGYDLVPEKTVGLENDKYGVDKKEVTYVYKKKPTIVTVHHKEVGGATLAPDTVINGFFEDKYTTTEEQIVGYVLEIEPTNKTGQHAVDPTEVTYYYSKVKTLLIVEHLDENDQPLIPTTKTTGEYKDSYETFQKEIEGYELDVSPANPSGNYTEIDTTVTYKYRKKDTQVMVHHITSDGTILTAPETLPGKFSDPYVTTQKEFEGYRLVATPTNAKGNYTMATPDVTYVYEKIPSNLIIRHVDEQGNEISLTKVISGKYGEEYMTEKQVIEGYELTEVPVNQNGQYTDVDTTVTYVYKKKATQVIVHHVDQAGNKLALDEVKNGLFNDVYQTEKLTIPGYVYLLVKGAPQKGKHKVATQEVTYVYAKIVPPTVDTVYEGATRLTGTGTPGTQVIITFPDGTTVSADVDADGKWAVDVPKNIHLKEGQINSAISFDPKTGFKSEKGDGNVIPLPKTSVTPGSTGTPTKKSAATNSASAKTTLPKTGEVNSPMSIITGIALLGLAVLNYLKRKKV